MKKYYEARIDFDFASVYSLVKYRELEKPKSELFFCQFRKEIEEKGFHPSPEVRNLLWQKLKEQIF